MNQKAEQELFIDYEIWILVFGGAFQRAYVYNASATEIERTAFRKALKTFVQDKILVQYIEKVSPAKHKKNLKAIITFAEKKEYKPILANQKFKLGISQKLLNLALKYFWCLGKVAEPPHFPIDRIILKQLNYKGPNWTSLESFDDYDDIIAKAAQIKNKEESLAAWELRTFKRR